MRYLRVLGLLLLATSSPTPSRAQSVALTHANIINLADGTIASNRTIVVKDGIIDAVLANGTHTGARTIDMRGAFVIPGLWDMHAHMGSIGRSALALYIANGITGVRDMGSDPAILLPWRDSIRSGKLLGPQMVVAGPIVERAGWLRAVGRMAKETNDSGLVRDIARRIGIDNPENAIAAVDSVIATHADFLKIRNDPGPSATFALLQHARARKLPVAGHWPANITPELASDSGYSSLEHGALSVVDRQLGPTLDRMSPSDRQVLFARFVRNGTAYTPTITTSRGFRLMADTTVARILNDSAGRSEPRMRYVSARVVAGWRADFALKKQETEQLDWQSFHQSWLRDIRPMVDAGVLLLAGTDLGSPLVFPAFSLHDELDAMVREAGLTSLQALRSATLNPAIYLHDERGGAVAVGKRADLVFLAANPLTDIQNVHRISAVMRGGKLLDRKALDALLEASRLR